MIQEQGELGLANDLNLTISVLSGSESSVTKIITIIEEIKLFRKAIKPRVKMYEECKYYVAFRNR